MRKTLFIAFLLNVFSVYLFCDVNEKYLEQKILEGLNSQESSIKIFTLENIESIELKNYLSPIKNLLKDKNEYVRLKAAYLVSKKDTDLAINTVIEILSVPVKVENTQSPVGRAKMFLKNKIHAEAVKILGRIGDEKIVKLLIKMKENGFGEVVDASYFALYFLATRKIINLDEEVKNFFFEALKSQDPKVRLKAVSFLGDLKEKQASAPLALRLKDYNSDVRAQALLGIAKIGDLNYIEEMSALRKDKEDSVRASLAESLGILAYNLVNSTNVFNVQKRVKIIDVLNELLSDVNGSVRLNSAVSLLRVGNRSGFEIIKMGLDSKDTDVIIYSIASIGNFGNKSDIDLIKEFLNNDDKKIQIATAISILKILQRDR